MSHAAAPGWSMSRFSLLGLALLGAGCPALPGHRCDSAPDSCGASGRCEPIGVCSFPAASCESGRAYGDDVMGELDGQCTPAMPPPCGARAPLLHDTFDDTDPAPAFRAYASDGSGSSAGERGGQLVVQLGPTSQSYAGYDSLARYDLRGGSIEAEVAQIADQARVYTLFGLSGAQGGQTKVAVGFNTGAPALTVEVDGNQLASAAWLPAERFWRIRESGGELIWEVSTDRVTYGERHRVAQPFDVSAVKIDLWGWNEGTGGELRFESVAVCGP